MIGVKRFASFEHPKSEVKQFAHNGPDDGHFGFASFGQSVDKSPNDGIESVSRKSGHVKGRTKMWIADFGKL